ncbi:MAG: radical SAM protein [Myxococcota bacterium]
MSEVTDIPEERGEASHRTKGLLRLTMACNERCPFCNVPAEDYDVLTPPMAEAEAEVDRFIAEGAQTLTISGGEPTLLKKRLLPLVERARSGGIRFVEIQTNATLITPVYAQRMAEAGVTSAFVSFLSHVKAEHDRLAGLEGAYEKCLAGMDALMEAGIRVTLNPVTAHGTARLLPDFIDFVASRLPGVDFISLSAVQPHGRGRDNAELLPDYAVLRETVPEARRRAAGHGIELVNPYCGLPACVGWSDDLSRSVEAFEASAGGWRETRGIDNVGNKSQGKPCEDCAVRTRCGGAWHAYWTVRNGAGIMPPFRKVEPWTAGHDGEAQDVVRIVGSPTAAILEEVAACTAPTVWGWMTSLRAEEVPLWVQSRLTDLAVEVDDLTPEILKETLRAARRLARINQTLMPQQRLRIIVGFRVAPATNPRALASAVSLARSLGVDGVRVLSADRRWKRLVQSLEASTGAPLSFVLTDAPESC